LAGRLWGVYWDPLTNKVEARPIDDLSDITVADIRKIPPYKDTKMIGGPSWPRIRSMYILHSDRKWLIPGAGFGLYHFENVEAETRN